MHTVIMLYIILLSLLSQCHLFRHLFFLPSYQCCTELLELYLHELYFDNLGVDSIGRTNREKTDSLFLLFGLFSPSTEEDSFYIVILQKQPCLIVHLSLWIKGLCCNYVLNIILLLRISISVYSSLSKPCSISIHHFF